MVLTTLGKDIPVRFGGRVRRSFRFKAKQREKGSETVVFASERNGPKRKRAKQKKAKQKKYHSDTRIFHPCWLDQPRRLSQL
jgi:hypothetical protein